MRHFTLQEFECRCGKCQMPPEARKNITVLVGAVLDPLREHYGRPIQVNSGYRCPAHNKAVGGVPNSQHLRGEAADITAGNPTENLKLARIIRENGQFDQLIYERTDRAGRPQWLHVSWKQNGNRGIVLW